MQGERSGELLVPTSPENASPSIDRTGAGAQSGSSSADLGGQSTRSYLLALSLALLLPLLLVAGYLAWRFGASERERFAQQSIDFSRSANIAIERELLGIKTALQVLATAESLAARDLPAFHARTVIVAALQDFTIALRDAEGRPLVNSAVPWGQTLPARSNFAEADAEALKSGRPALTDFFVGILNGRRSVGVAVPVRFESGDVWFLSASFDVERLRRTLVDTVQLPWGASLTDRDGLTIADTVYPDRAGVAVAAPFMAAVRAVPMGVWRGDDASGRGVIAAYRTLQGGWVVSAGAFVEEWNAALLRALGLVAAGSFVLIGAAVLGSLALGRRISGPIDALDRMGAALGRGDVVQAETFANREANAVARTLAAASVGLREHDAELRAASIRYRNALRVGRIGAWETDLVEGVRLWSPEGMSLFGLDLPEGKGQVGGPCDEWRNAFHPEDRPIAERIYAELAVSDRIQIEYRIRRPDGAELWLLAHGEVTVRDAAGGIRRLTNVVADITDIKRMQQALSASEERFRAIQETSIDGFMIMESVRDRDGRIVDFIWVYANEAAERIIGRERSWFLGRRLLVEMPGNREAGLFEAYARVVETGEAWTSEFTYRHEDLDIYVRAVAAKAGDGFAVSFADLSERRRAEERVRESEGRLASALKAGQLGVYEYDVRTDRLTWDAKLCELFGVPQDQPVSLPFFESRLHPDDRAEVRSAIAAALAEGRRLSIEYRIQRLADGATRWLIADGEAAFENGAAVRLVGLVRDVTAQTEAEAERRLLLDEMNHRVKNMLATVRAIAMQTLKGDAVAASVRAAFDGRLMALAAAHDLLMQEGWESARLADTVERTLAPHRGAGGRVFVDGDDAALSPRLALAVSLSLHELATNALKYGALSVPEGRVAVRWTTTGGRLRLTWREEGGPPVAVPQRKGFGSTLIERLLKSDAGGEARIEFRPDGVVCIIEAPLEAAQAAALR